MPRSFRLYGLIGWAACMLPTFTDLQAGRLSGWPAALWCAAFVVFGAACFWSMRLTDEAQRPRQLLLVGVQAAMGFIMVATAAGLTKYLCAITLTIVAGDLPYVLALRAARLWLAAQAALLATMLWAFLGPQAAVSAGLAFAAFQAFAFGRARLERQLATANAHLREASVQLAERSRVDERLRIARDLHDSLGHHLTALSIHLDVASRRLEGANAEAVREAHAITRMLLGDVRDVVTELRVEGRIDVAPAIRSLAQAATLRVDLDMPATLFLDDQARANAIIRCMQEVLTNAARHGDARSVAISVLPESAGVSLHARDDGGGTAVIVPGNGLKGMRERFEELAGSVDFTSMPGGGFEVRAFLPRHSPSAA